MPSDPGSGSNEIVGTLNLEPKTPLVIIELVDVPNVVVGAPTHEFGSRQKRPPTKYGVDLPC